MNKVGWRKLLRVSVGGLMAMVEQKVITFAPVLQILKILLNYLIISVYSTIHFEKVVFNSLN